MSPFAWHGAMTLLAWLVLLPAGALVARFYKVLPRQDFPAVRDSRAWWRAHLLLQYGGTALAGAGLWTAWDALDGAWNWSNPHAALGLAVMGLCVLQVVSAWLRGTKGGPTDIHADPVDPATWRGDHYDMTRRRMAFESWHKRAGYLAFALAVPTIWLGGGTDRRSVVGGGVAGAVGDDFLGGIRSADPAGTPGGHLDGDLGAIRPTWSEVRQSAAVILLGFRICRAVRGSRCARNTSSVNKHRTGTLTSSTDIWWTEPMCVVACLKRLACASPLSVHLVQATVGHANLTTTSRYAHARPNDSSSRYLPG